jgi:hypothetical protein
VKAKEEYTSTAGYPAAEGTVFHTIMEDAILHGKKPEEWIGETVKQSGFEIKVTPAMAEHADRGLDLLEEHLGVNLRNSHLMGDLHVELRVNLEQILGPGQFGTSDLVLFQNGTLYVHDHKYGYVGVDPEENFQAILYALGAENTLGVKPGKYVISIYQPRDPSGDIFKVWETNDLSKFRDELQKAAIAAHKENAPRVAGEEQCQFCPAKVACYQFKEWAFQSIEAFEPLDDIPGDLSDDELAQILNKKTAILRWFDLIEERLTEKLLRGEEVPGYELGQKRTRYIYSSPEEAERVLVSLLGDGAYKKELISPAQARKKVDGFMLEDLVDRPEGDPKIVRKKDEKES